MKKARIILTGLLEELRLDKTEFARMIGKDPQQISNYIRRDIQIKNKFANSILKIFPNINIRYLLYGEKPIISMTKEVSEISEKINNDTMLLKENELLKAELELVRQRNKLLEEELLRQSREYVARAGRINNHSKKNGRDNKE